MKIIWRSKTTYVDKDTGEQIPKSKIKDKEYRIITKTKKIIITNETQRTISYTNECSRNSYIQQTLI